MMPIRKRQSQLNLEKETTSWMDAWSLRRRHLHGSDVSPSGKFDDADVGDDHDMRGCLGTPLLQRL